jgi:uncharacterized damage-inducible protein DinB
MNLQDLEMLLDYHYWARDRMLEAVERLTPEQYNQDLGNSFRSMRDTVVHLFGADWIWCCRWQGSSPTALPDPRAVFPDVPSIRAAWREHDREIRGVLARLGEEGIGRPIEYRTIDGKLQAQPFWQMLQHLVNHGSYHRGQVTTMLRQLEAAPPKAMDLIAFYRERASAVA